MLCFWARRFILCFSTSSRQEDVPIWLKCFDWDVKHQHKHNQWLYLNCLVQPRKTSLTDLKIVDWSVTPFFKILVRTLCKWFKNFIILFIICKKVYFDHQLMDFLILLLFLHILSLCHILLFGCWIFFNTIRVSNSLDPDQTRPDLSPTCLQILRLSADNKIGP